MAGKPEDGTSGRRTPARAATRREPKAKSRTKIRFDAGHMTVEYESEDVSIEDMERIITAMKGLERTSAAAPERAEHAGHDPGPEDPRGGAPVDEFNDEARGEDGWGDGSDGAPWPD